MSDMMNSTSLRIGKTEVALLKENTYSIRTNDYVLDSIIENMEQQHSKHIKKINTKNVTTSLPHSTKEIEFNASSVMPLKSFLNKTHNQKGLSYDVLLHFIGNIGNQLTFLKRKGYAIPFISLEDIIVIDHTIFAFVNDNKVFKIESGDQGDDGGVSENIIIDFPMKFNKKNSFIPPMIKKYFGSGDDVSGNIPKLPIIIHYSWGFYSLAQICVFIFLRNRIADEREYEQVAGPFIYTPLYWCLKRCLDKNNSKRILLYI